MQEKNDEKYFLMIRKSQSISTTTGLLSSSASSQKLQQNFLLNQSYRLTQKKTLKYKNTKKMERLLTRFIPIYSNLTMHSIEGMYTGDGAIITSIKL